MEVGSSLSVSLAHALDCAILAEIIYILLYTYSNIKTYHIISYQINQSIYLYAPACVYKYILYPKNTWGNFFHQPPATSQPTWLSRRKGLSRGAANR